MDGVNDRSHSTLGILLASNCVMTSKKAPVYRCCSLDVGNYKAGMKNVLIDEEGFSGD